MFELSSIYHLTMLLLDYKCITSLCILLCVKLFYVNAISFELSNILISINCFLLVLALYILCYIYYINIIFDWF